VGMSFLMRDACGVGAEALERNFMFQTLICRPPVCVGKPKP
jgi:hypothetical protein